MFIKTKKFFVTPDSYLASKKVLLALSFKLQVLLLFSLAVAVFILYLFSGLSVNDFMLKNNNLAAFSLIYISFFVTFWVAGFLLSKKSPPQEELKKHKKEYIFEDLGFREKLYKDSKEVNKVQIDWSRIKKVFSVDDFFIFYFEVGIFLRPFVIPQSAFDNSSDIDELKQFLDSKKTLKNHNLLFNLFNISKKGLFKIFVIFVISMLILAVVN